MVKQTFIVYNRLLKLSFWAILSLPVTLYPSNDKYPKPYDRQQLINKTQKEIQDIFKKIEPLNDEEKEEALTVDNMQLPPSVIAEQLKKHDNDTRREIAKSADIQLSDEEIIVQYKNSLDKEAQERTLKSLLEYYSELPIERQKLINSLIKTYSYKDLLSAVSNEGYESVGMIANPYYAGALPVVDWINLSHQSSFFQSTLSNALIGREAFNDFNSLNQWGLWVEPFGFYTQLRQKSKPLQFNLYTVGLSTGGQFTFFERLLLGAGLAYSYSGVDWIKDKTTAHIHSLCFGPFLSYLFPNGYVSCTLLGLANFYQVNREINLFPKISAEKIKKNELTQLDFTGWDAALRLEGGFTYALGKNFFLYPTLRIDYLNVFKNEFTEQMDEDVGITVNSSNESFLSSKAGVKITREFFNADIGFLIPSLSIGLLYLNPLSKQGYKYQIQELKPFEENQKLTPWPEYFLGVGFSVVHKMGVLASLEYNVHLGAHSIVHTGSLRIEWSW